MKSAISQHYSEEFKQGAVRRVIGDGLFSRSKPLSLFSADIQRLFPPAYPATIQLN